MKNHLRNPQFIHKNKTGSVLIAVLIVISFCVSVILLIHERAIKSYSSVIDLQTEYQGAIYAMTVIKALELVFRYDTKSTDGSENIWNNIVPFPVDKGFLTVYIKPLNSKFPLNILAKDNNTNKERYETGFEKLTETITNETAPLEDLKSWLGNGHINTERFDENNVPYSFKGGQLDTLAELRFIPAFSNIFKDLSQYVSIGDTNGKININLASEEVIVSLLPELEPYMKDILEIRKERDFKDVSEIYTIMGQGNQEVYNKILPFFDVKSSLFYAKLELIVGNMNKYYHILFQKNGKSVKVIKYIEGPNIEYF